MDYGDANHQTVLEKEFQSLLDGADKRQEEWTRLRKKLYGLDKDLKTILPDKLKKIMILPFPDLAKIYEKYVNLKLSKKDEIHVELKALFNYDEKKENKYKALSSDLIEFFKNEKNGFKIHTCHYCDMAYINYFISENGKRTQFDLDHVLDKGRCPLVALSLYNLVPACPTCNGPHIKGQRVMPSSLEQRQKLSPTSINYDFDKNVKLWIKPKLGTVHNTNLLKHQDEYEIAFDTSQDPDYDIEINFFYLRQRYNYHKCEALRLEDLKAKYTPEKIKEMAKIICNIGKGDEIKPTLASRFVIDQIKADIFNLDFTDKYHRAFGKLHKDILTGNIENVALKDIT